MQSIRSVLLMSASLAISITSGCDQKTANPTRQIRPGSGPIAIVNLDQIAKSVGWNEEIQLKITSYDKDLQTKLVNMRESLRSAVENERKKFGPVPTREQQESLMKMAASADDQFRVAYANAQQETARFRSDLSTHYRDIIRPIARRIATDANQAVVMVTADNVLWFAPQADITNQIIDELQKVNSVSQPTTAPNPAPTKDKQ